MQAAHQPCAVPHEAGICMPWPRTYQPSHATSFSPGSHGGPARRPKLIQGDERCSITSLSPSQAYPRQQRDNVLNPLCISHTPNIGGRPCMHAGPVQTCMCPEAAGQGPGGPYKCRRHVHSFTAADARSPCPGISRRTGCGTGRLFGAAPGASEARWSTAHRRGRCICLQLNPFSSTVSSGWFIQHVGHMRVMLVSMGILGTAF